RLRRDCNHSPGFEPSHLVEETWMDGVLLPTLRNTPPSSRIWSPSSSPAHPMGVIHYIHDNLEGPPLPPRPLPLPPSALEALGREVSKLQGALVEVVLPEDVDPGPWLRSIISHRHGR